MGIKVVFSNTFFFPSFLFIKVKSRLVFLKLSRGRTGNIVYLAQSIRSFTRKPCPVDLLFSLANLCLVPYQFCVTLVLHSIIQTHTHTLKNTLTHTNTHRHILSERTEIVFFKFFFFQYQEREILVNEKNRTYLTSLIC